VRSWRPGRARAASCCYRAVGTAAAQPALDRFYRWQTASGPGVVAPHPHLGVWEAEIPDFHRTDGCSNGSTEAVNLLLRARAWPWPTSARPPPIGHLESDAPCGHQKLLTGGSVLDGAVPSQKVKRRPRLPQLQQLPRAAAVALRRHVADSPTIRLRGSYSQERRATRVRTAESGGCR
jgi:hypothetical protein